MLGHQEDAYFNAQVPVYQEQNPVEVKAMNVPQQGYGGFYDPNTQWSHLGFNYKNTTTVQNQNSFPK